MLKIIEKSTSLKSDHLVFFIQKKKDLEKLSFLKLDSKIIKKIHKIISEKKSTSETFFLGNSKVETLTIVFSTETHNRKLIEFLWKTFSALPSEITILSHADKNILTLLDVSVLSRYKFEKYKSKKKNIKTHMWVEDKAMKAKVKSRYKTLQNIILARELWETPACDLTPEAFADIVKKTKFKNTKIKIFSDKDIVKKKMWLIHAVGKGSVHKPRMVILERIVDKKLPTIGIVWKGIVFDTGGLDIKTKMMYEMKDDMCGAGTLFATMKELDDKKLNVNIVACLCLAENSISWESYRPSDIITSYSGQTVNIVNTDAEWRLVMADGISYISKNYKLDKIMTIATLTWVALFAMGYRYAAIMWNDTKFRNKFLDYSEKNFEMYNRLPFDEYYVEKTKSSIADIDNLTSGIYAGSTMWGAFLYNFVMNGEKYTHLDIAGVANNWYEPYGLYPKGTTGFGVDSISSILQHM